MRICDAVVTFIRNAIDTIEIGTKFETHAHTYSRASAPAKYAEAMEKSQLRAVLTNG
jgi:hypothetical protein